MSKENSIEPCLVFHFKNKDYNWFLSNIHNIPSDLFEKHSNCLKLNKEEIKELSLVLSILDTNTDDFQLYENIVFRYYMAKFPEIAGVI